LGNPIKPDFGGIDPAIFFDDNGKGYIVHVMSDKGKNFMRDTRVIKIGNMMLKMTKLFQERTRL
jgi:alpha-N-arabinofuranosidase